MQRIKYYNSPLGKLLLAADDLGLTGLWLDGQKYYASGVDFNNAVQSENEHIREASRWLDIYFCGKNPKFLPLLHQSGTEFRLAVWDLLKQIPYGETVSYGDIAKELACRRGVANISAQAVGGAVGHNSILIIVPCHRVVSKTGNLTGYAGGTDNKMKLLTLEKAIK